MRQRKVRNLDEKMAAVSAWMVEAPAPKVWGQVFPGRRQAQEAEQELAGKHSGLEPAEKRSELEPAEKRSELEPAEMQKVQEVGTEPDGKRSGLEPDGRKLFLEIGCGKGDFLLQHAQAHPENDYIGIEGQASVVLRAMEKAAQIQEAGARSDAGEGNKSDAGADTESDAGAGTESDAGTGTGTTNELDAGTGTGSDAGAGNESDAGIGNESDAGTGTGTTNESDAGAGTGPEGTSEKTLDNVRFVCTFVNALEELFAPGSLDGIYLNFSDPWPKARHAKRRLTWRGRLQDYAKALRPGGFIAIKTDNDALFEFTLEEIAACGWAPSELTWDLHGMGQRGTEQTRDPYEERHCDQEARQFMTEYERKFREAGKQIHYVKVIL